MPETAKGRVRARFPGDKIMAMLGKDVRNTTKKRFDAELVDKVKVLHFTSERGRLFLPGSQRSQDGFFCKETLRLLEEVAALSEKIDLQIIDIKAEPDKAAARGIEMIPATVLAGAREYGIRFFGIPSGYEYVSLLDALIDVSRGKTSLASKTKEALRTVDRDIHLQVFITPTCVYCSQVVRLAHQFALESAFVKADMIESQEFPKLADRFNVRGVPKTVINGTHTIEGAVPEDVYLDHVLKALAQFALS
jgi:glutaredoxin-like protein